MSDTPRTDAVFACIAQRLPGVVYVSSDILIRDEMERLERENAELRKDKERLVDALIKVKALVEMGFVSEPAYEAGIALDEARKEQP